MIVHPATMEEGAVAGVGAVAGMPGSAQGKGCRGWGGFTFHDGACKKYEATGFVWLGGRRTDVTMDIGGIGQSWSSQADEPAGVKQDLGCTKNIVHMALDAAVQEKVPPSIGIEGVLVAGEVAILEYGTICTLVQFDRHGLGAVDFAGITLGDCFIPWIVPIVGKVQVAGTEIWGQDGQTLGPEGTQGCTVGAVKPCTVPPDQTGLWVSLGVQGRTDEFYSGLPDTDFFPVYPGQYAQAERGSVLCCRTGKGGLQGGEAGLAVSDTVQGKFLGFAAKDGVTVLEKKLIIIPMHTSHYTMKRFT